MPGRSAYPLAIGIIVLLGMVSYYNLCSICDSSPLSSTRPIDENPYETRLPLAEFRLRVEDGEGFQIESTSDFPFHLQSGQLRTPLEPSLHEVVIDLAGYLRRHPSKVLHITGFYSTEESNPTPYRDIGYARARALRDYARVHTGLPATRFILHSRTRDSMPLHGGLLSNPLDLRLGSLPQDFSSGMDSIRKLRRKESIRLPFLYEDSPIFLEQGQKQALTELISCLEYFPNLNCQVVGYTDSRGSASVNFQFGMRRANFVSAYLQDLGIPKERIEVSSRGERNPIASNDTPVGRAENRRVELRLSNLRK